MSETRAALRRTLSPQPETASFNLNRPIHDGFLDFIRTDPCGLISIVGWSRSPFITQDAPTVSLDGEAVSFLRHFRVRRADVGSSSHALCSQAGLQLDYLVPEPMLNRRWKVLSVQPRTGGALHFEVNTKFLNPDYRPLFYTNDVLHRDHIYGSGLPNLSVHPHIVELARELKGPVLDFGCGRGALIGELLRTGTEIYGLELASDVIRASIPGNRSHLVTLYDGSFPTPFPDGRFRSVICSEVLEHIPDFQAAIREISRLAAEKVIFTVPDASAIPIGFRHGSVPWHLMEATHVNFFNQESLKSALEPCFSQIEFGRIGLAHFNDSAYNVSLVAVCLKSITKRGQ